MEKNVKGGYRHVEITLDGTECAVKFDSKYNGFEVYNKSGGEVIVSLKSGGVKGEDGVMTAVDGEDLNYMHYRRLDTVYITGTGDVKVCAKNEATRNFSSKRRGGDSAKAGNKLSSSSTESGYLIQTNGIAKSSSLHDIVHYAVNPHSAIYVKAKDDTNACKFVWYKSNVISTTGTSNLVGTPITAATDGLVIVPEDAKYISFSQLKTDTETGIYEIILS